MWGHTWQPLANKRFGQFILSTGMIINCTMRSQLVLVFLGAWWVSSWVRTFSDLNYGKGDLGYTSTDSFMGCRPWLNSRTLTGTHIKQVAMNQPSSTKLGCLFFFFRTPHCQLLHGYLIRYCVKAHTGGLDTNDITAEPIKKKQKKKQRTMYNCIAARGGQMRVQLCFYWSLSNTSIDFVHEKVKTLKDPKAKCQTRRVLEMELEITGN